MKKFSLLLFAILSTVLLSCDSLVDGLNDDPNLPTEAPSDIILTGTQVGLIQALEGDLARRCGMWSGYFTGEAQQYEGFYNYIPTAGDFNAGWEDLYANAIRNAKVAQQTAETEGNTGIITGITDVLYALAAGTSTALWGNVPFSQAGDYNNFPTPSFEDQADVYAGLQVLLDGAISNLGTGTGRPATGTDLFFNGDPDRWTEVAWTLKARFYMDTREYQSAYEAALNGIGSASNSMVASHSSARGTENLYYQFFAGNRDQDLSSRGAHIVGLLNPEASGYRGNARTNETARFGFLLISTAESAVPNTDGIFSIDSSFPLVSFEENLLTLAEAGVRARNFDIGLGHLNEFRAYMSAGGYIGADPLQYDAYDAADFDAGGMENQDGISSENALLREILEERYITFFGQIKGYIDVRRTLDESNVRVQLTPNTGDRFPQRFLYPQTEVDQNPNTPDPIPGIFTATPINQ